MAFFEELGKVISDKSKEAAGKVKDITGVIQLKTRLSSEKEKVNKAYIALGKAYYDKHEASVEEALSAEFETIRTGLIKMAELEDEIAELEGTRVCAECGAKVERNAAFCSKCGASMAGASANPAEETAEEAAAAAPVAEELIFAEEESEAKEQ
ncbi:MAG: zinc ribbon domain-containing protein [Otoolea sp.]|nr:zinc ribbon domain-containing protein [Clostridium sp.]